MTDPFLDQFLDDYYAEAEEHLAGLRTVLLALEEQQGVPRPEQHAEILRALHTLKGLSAMVGFSDAESLAHALEESLRQATARGAAYSAESLAVFFEGTRLLERCIAAHRSGDAAPPLAPFLERMGAGRSAPAGPAQPRAEPSAAVTAAERTVTFEFTPSRELVRRGVTVDVVRERLGTIGRIVSTTPLMNTGGVVFRFVVACAEDPAVPEQWLAEGLVQRESSSAPSPSAAAAQSTTDAVTALSTSHTVRVDLERLDELMRVVGDLVITRARLDDGIARLDHRQAETAYLEDVSGLFERQIRTLRDSVIRVRMVPIGEVFERMRFAARETARETGRQVAVTLSGQTTEVDKLIVERMMEPLLHLVRNAVSHGIETPAERTARGKSVTGHVTLSARTDGDRIVVEVADDGRGIDTAAVAERARSIGMLPADAELHAGDVLDLLAAPGFSTRTEADLTSGRGVGMAVVRQRVAELGGQLELQSGAGNGTRFVIRLPVTLMIIDAILFTFDGRPMAVPQQSVREVLQVSAQDITTFENNEIVPYRDDVLPLLRLESVFGAPLPAPRALQHVLVIDTADMDPVGIVVERITGQREIVVRALTDPLVSVPGISGATELSGGTVALILDAVEVAGRAAARSAGARR